MTPFVADSSAMHHPAPKLAAIETGPSEEALQQLMKESFRRDLAGFGKPAMKGRQIQGVSVLPSRKPKLKSRPTVVNRTRKAARL
jgi:hypothetical protein